MATIACLSALAWTPGVAHAAPPANDNFAAAQALTGDSAAATGTLLESTREPGEPDHGSFSKVGSVWYRWKAPSDGALRVDLRGGQYRTVSGVYQGSAVNALTTISAGTRSYWTIRVRAGETYHIAVGEDTYDRGSLRIELTLRPQVANDDFANAEHLDGTAAFATGDNSWATKEPGERDQTPYLANASLWYEWTAPYAGPVIIDTRGSNFNTLARVYTGESVTGLSFVASNDTPYPGETSAARIVFNAVPGTTYRIAVDGGAQLATGQLQLRLLLRPPPDNDRFDSAAVLPSEADVSVAGRNDGGTAEAGEPSHRDMKPPQTSVWFAYTPPKEGSLTIDAIAPAGEYTVPVTAVYTGTSVGELTRVTRQAEPCCQRNGHVRIRVEEGQTYYIAVDAFYPDQGGDFTLNLALIDRPPNDDFADAELLEGRADDTAGTNVGATQEPGEPVHEQNYYDPSVWYTWTAPATGGVTIDTSGSDFRTVIAVYRGDAVNALTREPSNAVTTPTGRAKRAFRAVAGETYRIAVDGSHAERGSIKLALRFEDPPANDNFAEATEMSGGSWAVDHDNIGATGETGEPGGSTQDSSVWYTWTAPATGRVEMSLKSDAPRGFMAYVGDSVGTLRKVGSTMDWDPDVWFRAEAGQTYRIEVDGGTTPVYGNFTLRVEQKLPRPANDDFANAQILAPADRVDGTTIFSTREPTTGKLNAHTSNTSVWYRWTAPVTGPAVLEANAPAFYADLGIYTGEGLDNLTAVMAESERKDGRVTRRVRVTRGTTYWLAISGINREQGDFSLTVGAHEAPANDNFADAEWLGGPAAAATGDNTWASGEPNVPGGGNSVWYRWTAPFDGRVTFRADGDGFQATPRVFTGSSGTALTRVWDDIWPWHEDLMNPISFRAVRGTTYSVAVSGTSSVSGGPVTGRFTLRLDQEEEPANDDFARAAVLTGNDDEADGDNIGATTEPGEPKDQWEPRRAVWYSWTAPSTGRVDIDAIGSGKVVGGTSDYQPMINVYTGGSVDKLTGVGDDDYRNPGNFLFRATAGTTYRIAVHGYDGYDNREGRFHLKLRHNAGPANDATADAQPLSGRAFHVTGTNRGAFHVFGEIDPTPDLSGVSSVWYRWTAPASGDVSLTTAGSDFDTAFLVRAYLPDRSYIAGGNDDADGTKQSRSNFGVTKGRDYWIVVAGVGRSEGRIELDLKYVRPQYDRFADAHLITPGHFGYGYNAAAGSEPGEPRHGSAGGGSSIWFAWQAPDDGRARMNTQADFDTVLAVYRGETLETLTPVASNDDAASDGSSAVEFNAVKGTTYRIAVDGQRAGEETPWGWSRVFVDFEAGVVKEEPPAEDPPVAEDPPAEEPPAEDPPVEEPPADNPPVENPPAEDPPAEDPPAEDPPAEDPPAEDSPPSDPPVDDPLADEPPAEEPVDDPPAQQQPADEPRSEQVPPSTAIPAPTQPAAGPAAPPTSRPLTLAASLGRQKLKTVLSKGLTATVSCASACAVEASAALDPNTAKRLGLKAAGAPPIGSVAVQANGPTKVVFKLSAAAKRKLAKVKSLKLTIHVIARDPGGRTATLARKLTIKR